MPATDDQLLLVRVEASISKFEKSLAQASSTSDRTVKKIQKQFAGLDTQLNRFGRNAFGGLLGSLTAFLGARAVLGAFVKNTEDAEKATAQLQAVLKSTGGAAGVTLGQLQKLAAELQRTTTFDDEAVASAEALLLTFTKIGKETFPQALTAVLDMSTALGQDLKSSSVQLGKALNDPIKGITALRKVGVSFSDAQTKVIKGLVQTGDLAKAQALILKELQVEFGGSAVAARDTLGGALTALGNAWSDLFELAGPAADGLRDSINELVSVISDSGFKDDIAAIGTVLFEGLARAAKDLHELIDEIRFLKSLFPELGSAGNDSFTDVANAAQGAAAIIENALTGAVTKSAAELVNEIAQASAELNDLQTNGSAVSDDLGFIDAAQAKLKGLQDQLAALTSQSWVINVELHRTSEDASMEALAKMQADQTPTLPAARPTLPPLAGGGSTGSTGSGGKSPAEKFKDDIAQIQERTRALQADTAAVGKSTLEAAKLTATQDLLNQALRDGVTITPKVREEIDKNAEAYAEAAARLEATQNRFQAINDLTQQFGEGAIDSFEGLLDKTSTLNDVLADTAKAIRHAALEAVLLGQGPLAQLLGLGAATTGGTGGLLGSLLGIFGGARAGGGPVDPGRIYKVGERGPELFAPRMPGQIIPNGSRGGTQRIENVIHVDASPLLVYRIEKGDSNSKSQAIASGPAVARDNQRRYGVP